MTLFVLSDTHVPEISRRIPEDFLAKIKPDDILFHAGDFTDLKTLKDLQKRCKVYAVRGNMDDPEVKRILPEKRIVDILGKKIGIFHGSGAPLDLPQRVLKKFDEKLDVLVFGHSHASYHRKIGDTLLFNPGSLAGDWRSKSGTYGILRLEDEKIWADLIQLRQI